MCTVASRRGRLRCGERTADPAPGPV